MRASAPAALLHASLLLVACGDTDGATSSGTGATTSTTTTGAGGASTSTATGGAGGASTSTAAGGAGGATTTTTGAGGVGGSGASGGAGGGAPAAQVECVVGSVTCAAGEVCCYHSALAACDHCAASGQCLPFDSGNGSACDSPGDQYFELTCAHAADCPANTVCCGHVEDGIDAVFVLGTSCRAACDPPDERVMCLGDGDCASLGKACKSADYGSYGFCD